MYRDPEISSCLMLNISPAARTDECNRPRGQASGDETTLNTPLQRKEGTHDSWSRRWISATGNASGCHVCTKHLILHLNEGNGRTTLLRFMTETYQDYHVRSFPNLELFIEETIPPTLRELRQMELRITSCSVFANCYSGVIALDAAGLEKRLNDAEYLRALRLMIANLREHALLVFFLPEKTNAHLERVELLLEEMCDYYTISLPACSYSTDELAAILGNLLEEDGIFPGMVGYPADLREYVEMHVHDASPHTLKRLVRNIRYENQCIGPQTRNDL